MRVSVRHLIPLLAALASCAGSDDTSDKGVDTDTVDAPTDTDVQGDTDSTTDTDVADTDTTDTDATDTDATDTDTLVTDTDVFLPDETTSGTVDENGGTLTLPNGTSVEVPANGLSMASPVDLTWVDDVDARGWPAPPAGALAEVGEAVVLTPHGTTFDAPVTVNVATTLTGDEVVLLRLDDEDDTTWEAAGPVSVSGGFATFQVDHFSVYLLGRVAAGTCPCWNGADLRAWDTANAARQYALPSRYASTSNGGVQRTTATLQTQLVSDALGVNVDPVSSQTCWRTQAPTDALFSGATATTTPDQGEACALLLASKFVDRRDGYQIAFVTTGLPAGESIVAALQVGDLSQGLIDQDITILDGNPAWALGAFTDDSAWTATIRTGPTTGACAAESAGIVSGANVQIDVTCGPDADSDGTPDAVDQCPADPTKAEPGVCGCDVSDADSDHDTVSDCVDNCANDFRKTEPGFCGCGQPEDDSDRDLTPDCVDQCPTNPDKIEPGTCGCYTTDFDEDGDGFLACLESCPTDPAKTQPGVCGCGVSDANDDGDLVPNCQELTPVAAAIDPSTYVEGAVSIATYADDFEEMAVFHRDRSISDDEGALRVTLHNDTTGAARTAPLLLGSDVTEFDARKTNAFGFSVLVGWIDQSGPSPAVRLSYFGAVPTRTSALPAPLIDALDVTGSVVPEDVLVSDLSDGSVVVAVRGAGYVELTVVDPALGGTIVSQEIVVNVGPDVLDMAIVTQQLDQGRVMLLYTMHEVAGNCASSCTDTYTLNGDLFSAVDLSSLASGGYTVAQNVMGVPGSGIAPVSLAEISSSRWMAVWGPGDDNVEGLLFRDGAATDRFEVALSGGALEIQTDWGLGGELLFGWVGRDTAWLSSFNANGVPLVAAQQLPSPVERRAGTFAFASQGITPLTLWTASVGPSGAELQLFE
jgi:hypothetical protein